MVEVVGTAPTSAMFITKFVYRHSWKSNITNIISIKKNSLVFFCLLINTILEIMLRNTKLNLIFTLIVIIILYSISSNIIYQGLVFPMYGGQKILFEDWNVIISAIQCENLGYDVFLENPCDKGGRKHVYGSIFLLIPFFERYSDVYLIYFPYFIILVFISVIIFHFNLRNILDLILCVLFIFSPSLLLAIERFNNDILIFLILLFTCYSRSNFTNLILISLASMAKFYPIVSAVVLLFKGKYILRLLHVFVFLSLIILFFYFDWENIKKIFLAKSQFTGSSALSFSIYNFVTLLSPLQMYMSKLNLLIFILIFTFFLTLGTYFMCKEINILKNFNFSDYKNRLFFLGLIICVFVYFVFNNYYYREIFLFFIIPFLLIKKDDHYIMKFIIYFLLGRHLIFFTSNYLYLKNYLTDYLIYFLSFKAFLDLILISMLFGILLVISVNLFNFNLKLKK